MPHDHFTAYQRGGRKALPLLPGEVAEFRNTRKPSILTFASALAVLGFTLWFCLLCSLPA